MHIHCSLRFSQYSAYITFKFITFNIAGNEYSHRLSETRADYQYRGNVSNNRNSSHFISHVVSPRITATELHNRKTQTNRWRVAMVCKINQQILRTYYYPRRWWHSRWKLSWEFKKLIISFLGITCMQKWPVIKEKDIK